MTREIDTRGYEIECFGYGVVLYEDIGGYAVVKVDGKVKKRFTNKKENAWGDAFRFAGDIFFERQRGAQ